MCVCACVLACLRAFFSHLCRLHACRLLAGTQRRACMCTRTHTFTTSAKTGRRANLKYAPITNVHTYIYQDKCAGLKICTHTCAHAHQVTGSVEIRTMYMPQSNGGAQLSVYLQCGVNFVSRSVCVCVGGRVCVCVCVGGWVRVWVYVCALPCALVCVGRLTASLVHAGIHVRVCLLWARKHPCTHTRIHTHTRTRTHARPHTHTHQGPQRAV